MRISLRFPLSGAAVAVSLVALTLGAAAPAQAHEPPKAGSRCAMSGMTQINHGSVYVCTSRTPDSTPRWGTGAKISRSSLTVSDGWAKAADSGMSAAFGAVANPTRKAIRVVGAYSPFSRVVQLHEVVAKAGSMVMQQKSGGFLIPAGGTLDLKPGGSHLMFLKITKPITAGTVVPVTLITADGGLLRVKVLGKVFAGANEDYPAGMSGMPAR